MAKYQDMVFSTACRLLGNQADAQDISQVVFLKAFQHFADLAENPAAGGWLKTTCTNLSLNHLTRYRARWRFFSEFRRDDDDESHFAEDLPAPPTSDENADRRALLESLIQKLPAAQRVPLVLFHFEQLGYDEIARRLRVSLSKVKTDIHRARLKLKGYIKPELLQELQGEPAPSSRSTERQAPRFKPQDPPFARYALRYEPGF
jgi:RNA polymerase sigma-70 factor (ECF subfamily)